MTSDPSYPAVRLIARHANTFAVCVGLALAVLGLWALIDHAPMWVGVAFMGAGVIAYVLLRSYGELVRIFLDTLLPQ